MIGLTKKQTTESLYMTKLDEKISKFGSLEEPIEEIASKLYKLYEEYSGKLVKKKIDSIGSMRIEGSFFVKKDKKVLVVGYCTNDSRYGHTWSGLGNGCKGYDFLISKKNDQLDVKIRWAEKHFNKRREKYNFFRKPYKGECISDFLDAVKKSFVEEDPSRVSYSNYIKSMLDILTTIKKLELEPIPVEKVSVVDEVDRLFDDIEQITGSEQ